MDYLNKIQAGPDGIDIHEDLPLPEVTFQPVINPAGMGSAIVTAVADEDLRHNPPSFGNDYGTACVNGIVRRASGPGKLEAPALRIRAPSKF